MEAVKIKEGSDDLVWDDFPGSFSDENRVGKVAVEGKFKNKKVVQLRKEFTPEEEEESRGKLLLKDGIYQDLPTAERIGMLRGEIQRMNLLRKQFQVISITSAVPGEGKSFISVNLARSFASFPDINVLLIDCDLRKPTIHSYFGLGEGPGFSDLVIGTDSYTKPVINTVSPNLDVMTCGSPVLDYPSVFEPQQFKKVITDLRGLYTYIIIDTPPVLLCPEPLMVSCLVDGTISVVRAWKTEQRLVKSSVNLIGRERLIGMVMNDAKDELRDYGYYGYYGSYGSRLKALPAKL